ncbi:hypothetical protein SLS63_010387 [Diaporthe eres]|uniref:Uncharacterized protein n=1 Tax=Diaporthe eres TaxID=83184 RepID=A0ABR1NWW9_DIAER
MSSAFAEAGALERGTNADQAPPVVAEAIVPEVDGNGNGRNSDEPGSTTIPSSTDEDDLEPERDTGQVGLARLKSYDSRFNFYPAFPTGRSLVVESLAWEIHRVMMKMKAQRKKIKAKHHVEPCRLSRGKRDRKKWDKMMTKLQRKTTEYDLAFVNAKTVNEYECPREEALKTLQDWLNKQDSALRHLYNGQDVDGFLLTMCVLVSVLAQVTEKDEGRRWLLVFAYLATISALLS